MDSKELELLIKDITGQVVVSMLKQGELASTKDLDISKGKYMLVLVSDCMGDVRKFITYLTEKFPQHELVLGLPGKVCVSGLEQVGETVDINEDSSRQKLSGMINKFTCIYLIQPGVMNLKSIADCDDREFIEKLIIYQALHGKSAGIVLDYDISSLPSNSLTKKVRGLLDSISSMGISVELLNEGRLDKKPKCTGYGKTLITEKDIDEMFKNGLHAVEIGKGTIITPLAKDRVNELGMKVTYSMQ